MIDRAIYMKQLLNFQDKPFIKVITGMRRCGKSTLLDLFERHLLESGVSPDLIVHMNFESMLFEDLKDHRALYRSIVERIPKDRRSYVLLDEVQQVDSWERAVNSLMVDRPVDLYITGSNAYLLSSELATLLSGRYIEIRMLPLSFREYLDFHEFNEKTTLDEKFDRFLEYGGLPAVAQLKGNEGIFTALSGIYSTVIMKDVVQRNPVKDISLLENLVRFLMSNVGSEVSAASISRYLTSNGRPTANETIDNYMTYLENAFIIYKARRFDIKGKLYLKTLGKYYIVDSGIRNALLGKRDTDIGHVLENVVYLELLRRYPEVCIGRVRDREVDFIATGPDEIQYFQVTRSLTDEAVLRRELSSLESIEDNHGKTILSMDRNYVLSQNGIRFQNIIDFLLEG